MYASPHPDDRLTLNNSTSSQYKTYLIAHNQAYYRGPWSKGLPEGKGTCIFADGSYYEGDFLDGEADDEHAHLILPTGASYRGQIKKSIIEGEGEMRQSVGSEDSYIYKGTWKAGKPHGHGVEKYGDGSEYEGPFANGLKSCFDPEKTIEEKEAEFRHRGTLTSQGVYRSAAGEIYRGEFLNGRMHGFGDYSRPDGSLRYTGQFHNGKKQGHGSVLTKTGVMSGEFKNDLINGPGRFEWSKEDGRVYEGHFKDSKFHGEGRITLKNGNVLEGLWEDGHSLELKAVRRL
jgi:hypothetical protein